jgi:hypothetical protein
MKIAKYQFDSQEQAESKVRGLGVETYEGNEIPLHDHTVVHLGHIVLEDGVYDEDGNEVTAPVLSDKWHVDVLWQHTYEVQGEGDDAVNVLVEPTHPYGWATYKVDLDTEGVHGFYGLSYQDMKLA